METLQDNASGSEPPSPPSGSGKLGRIAAHTQGIVEDLREWIDLRLDLALLEVEERVDELRNELALGLTLAVVGLFAAIFVLATVALGLGWMLGHPFWGFLAVSVALVLIVVGLNAARPDLVPPSRLFEQVRGRRPGERPDSRTNGTPVSDETGRGAADPSSS